MSSLRGSFRAGHIPVLPVRPGSLLALLDQSCWTEAALTWLNPAWSQSHQWEEGIVPNPPWSSPSRHMGGVSLRCFLFQRHRALSAPVHLEKGKMGLEKC